MKRLHGIGWGNDTLGDIWTADTFFIGNDADYSVCGSAGQDTFSAGNGDNVFRGGAGNDTVTTLDGNDTLFGGAGDDWITTGVGDSTAYGGAGNDFLEMGRHDLPLAFGPDVVLYYGNPDDGGNEVAYGGAGNDIILAYAGNDTLDGGIGDDFIFSGKGNDVIYAGTGNDFIYGDDGNDTLFGGAGNDILVAGNGSDALFGGAGNDIVYAGVGDMVDAGSGHDILLFTTDASSPNSGVLNTEGFEVLNLEHVSGMEGFHADFTQQGDIHVVTAGPYNLDVTITGFGDVAEQFGFDINGAIAAGVVVVTPSLKG